MSDTPGNVSSIVQTGKLTDDQVILSIQAAAGKSRNVFFDLYVDEELKSLDYSHLQILKVIRKGTFTNIVPERGCPDNYGFTACFKFGGEVEACHIRGWFNYKASEVFVSDVFMDEDMCV